MPNWVKHNVQCYGSKKELDNFKTKHFKEQEGEMVFDFNTIIKMPDHIFTGSLGQEEREKYGEDNWYDWSLKNWGTKWNAENVFISPIRKSKGKDYILSFTFNTAWSTPYQIIDKMVLMHPDLFFEVEFADEDIGSNCGYYHCEDGASLTFVDYDEEFANNVWGYSEELSE